MRSPKLLKISFSFVVLHFFCLPFCAQVTGNQNQITQKTLNESLRMVGDVYDCYFTVEEALVSGDQLTSIEEHRVSLDMNNKSLRQVLDIVRMAVPNLTYELDTKSPRIVHVIDRRLLGQKRYAMEESIDQLQFEGFNFDFVQAIALKNIKISAAGPLSTGEALAVDFKTRVNVNVRNIKVRDLLTRAVPVLGRQRILWYSRTDLESNSTTYIRFLN
jgi:hypothetical protein